jgi:hypothetical protein
MTSFQELSPVARWSAIAAASAGALSIVGCFGGGTETPGNTRPTIESCFVDADCDGIRNDKDRSPQVSDGVDADSDGLKNIIDSLPYDPSNGISGNTRQPGSGTLPQQPGTGNQQPAPLPCNLQPGIDKDNDGWPDHCDPVMGIRDSDKDGLEDSQDTYPHTADRDNDGLLDGSDPNPNVNEKREAERLETERLEKQRLERERLEKQRLQERQDATYGIGSLSYTAVTTYITAVVRRDGALGNDYR